MIDRFLSLFRFNITFKLTLELILTIISFMILVNLIFYVGIKAWMYMESVEIMERASEIIENEIKENEAYSIDNPILDFEDMECFIYQGQDNKLVASNIDKKIAYKEHEKKMSPYMLIKKNMPEWFYYHNEIEKDNQQINIILRKKALKIHEEIDFLWSILISISIILILLIGVSSSRISRKHLKPIKIMTQKVQDISVNNLDTRIDVRGTKDELKDLAYTFNKMMDEIENSYEKQRQFVSDASHELRTPIAVIKGYASMVNRWGKEDHEVLEESLKAIEDEARNMQSLVESLLFLARRDKGTLEMEKEKFNIKDFIIEIIKESSLIDSHHNFDSELEYDGEIFASQDKLKQALRVFIDNSMKYTPEKGSIKINLKASNKDVYIIIEDTGVGISKEDLPHIFERFYRADQARTRSGQGGTGLGLAIAKVIIEHHKGKVVVDSELNKGTCVTIILPKGLD